VTISNVVERVLCPVLVRRDDELAVLEDALLAAHRGESRFVMVGGDAGIGKTRLITELAGSARKLGGSVLWGSCSEAELSLPYLPFVEAIGNYLAAQDVAALAERLGPARRELAQLFPQLSDGTQPEPAQDPAQAKLRLFEAVVTLLTSASEHQPLLIVTDDIHWADESTRELLDHLSRRLTALPALLVVTYRADELHRRHPLAPVVQSWRRSGLAETVKLEALPPAGVAEMIRAMFDAPEVEADFRNLMFQRSEGNPFVLEEMLKEAIERGDIFRTAGGWERKPLHDLDIPDTVRDTILLRLERLDPLHATILQAAAALGRVFDHRTLLAVSDAGAEAVNAAVEAAVGQQLIEEHPEARESYRWRHALTQEAIYGDMVLPRRQQLHARAADVLAAQPATRAVDVVHHLLGAARFAEAVPLCVRAAEEAERASAFGQAVSVLEQALPHVSDPLERARVVCSIGRLSWFNGDPAAASQFLSGGVEALESLGEPVEAARFRVILGRCHWELLRSDQALRDLEAARDVLEQEGPSADLAVAYIRIAGLRMFEFDYDGCVEASQKAIEVAERAGADFERLWAHSWLGVGLTGIDVERGFAVIEGAYDEAIAKGYWLIAGNVGYNDIWSRVHLFQPGIDDRLLSLESLPSTPGAVWSSKLGRGYVRHATGELADAEEGARHSLRVFEELRQGKMVWRARVNLAEVLVEMGRTEEAARVLPPVAERSDLQDIVYDGAAQIRVRLERGQVAEAAELAEEILQNAERLAMYRGTLGVAVEAFLAAERIDDARAVVAKGRAEPSPAGKAVLDEAEAQVLLADGAPDAAVPLLRSAVEELRRLGYRLAEWRATVVLAEALGRSGKADEAAELLRELVPGAEAAQALRIAAKARAVAGELGVDLGAPEPARVADSAPEAPAFGERLVTSLFADVRGYTALTVESSPQELTERMTSLYRFARTEVERHFGIVDKFAGDAVMATFNVSGSRIDHCFQALQAALALRDKAALLDLQLGIGIAVGPAVLAAGASDANVAVRGVATNLAARLQAAAGGGEILLSADAFRRVEDWLAERGVSTQREQVELKGFEGPQAVYRLAAPTAAVR
jgi:class 3 adenylate cyclase